MWVDKYREIYSISVKIWLEKNDIKIYSTHNEENPVFTERFIRTLKNKIYECMNSLSKMCILIN